MNPTTNPTGTNKLFFYCGILGPVLFVILFLTESYLRVDYLPLKHPISSLAIGERGWIQISNFILSGTLILVFALGSQTSFRSQTGTRTLTLQLAFIGIGLIGAGIFKTDPVYGYPLDQPLRLAQFTTTGHLHDLFSLFVFFCLPCTCFIMRRVFKAKGKQKLANFAMICAFTVIVSFILSGIGFKQLAGLTSVAGFLQRSCIITGCMWIVALSLYFIKKEPK